MALLLIGNMVAVRAADAPPVTALDNGSKIIMDNGTVTLEILKAKSEIVSVKYRHQGQTTEMCKTMYYSASAGPTDRNAPRPPAGSIQIRPNQPTHLARSGPDSAEVVMENGPTPTYPFHTETHYVLPRGESGYYAYQLYSHPADQPAATIGEARFVLKGPPGPVLYTTHVIDALRMAPYSVLPIVRPVSDATYLLQDGSIYTKYDNTAFMADASGEHHVHGMTGHGVGIWMVNASNEYINGGPVKQELTVHADNTLLNMLQGWGDPLANAFDLTKINVENDALGGRSSRTFLTEGLWDKTLAMLKAGDFVLIQFGHNDGGSLTTSYRASIKGNGEEMQEVTDAKTGKKEVVHTYGWYLRKYINDAKAQCPLSFLRSLAISGPMRIR